MEQANQEITQKPVLPIKTKIAAWWMTTIGIIFLIISLLALILFLLQVFFLGQAIIKGPFGLYFMSVCLASLLGVIFYFNPGLALLRKKKWAWRSAVLKLSLLIILFVILYCFFAFSAFLLSVGISPGHSIPSNFEVVMASCFVIPFIIFFTPLILLILDRKNFFKIAP